jgi:hypothetical protein
MSLRDESKCKNKVYLPLTRQQLKKYGSYKYKDDIRASQDNKPMKYMLADIKLQQNESVQQQYIFCNNCKKNASKMLEKTMKR